MGVEGDIEVDGLYNIGCVGYMMVLCDICEEQAEELGVRSRD